MKRVARILVEVDDGDIVVRWAKQGSASIEGIENKLLHDVEEWVNGRMKWSTVRPDISFIEWEEVSDVRE